MTQVLIELCIPLLGTVLGAGTVFFMKKNIKLSIQKLLLGFAAGIMISASIWSLLLPAMEMAEGQGKASWVPASIGFLLGILFLLLLDSLIPHIHIGEKSREGPKTKLEKTTMFILAVTLHNIPEGMAVGVMLASILSGKEGIHLSSAFVLSLGIAIQNFPEGAIISMPLRSQGMSKKKAFFYGVISGIVEPIGSILTILVTNLVIPLLPYLLSFAAGAMIYVVVEELIPELQAERHSNIGTIGVAIGFVVMLILDVTLG